MKLAIPLTFGALNVILVTSGNAHIGKEVVSVLRSNVLGWLLRRKPTDFPEYIRRASAEKQ